MKTVTSSEPRVTTLTTLLAAACMAIVTACAADTDGAPGVQCAGSVECEHGLTCSFNFCVEAAPNHLALMARIVPPPSTGLLPQQVQSLSLTDGPNLLVTLLPSQHVRGVVTRRGAPSLSNVAGEIEVRAPDVIHGFDPRFNATSLDGTSGPDNFGFDLAVLPGRSYLGTFRPADPELPRFDFELPVAAVDAGRFDIELPARSEYVTVRGLVRHANPETPVLGARVVVLTGKSDVAAVTKTDDIRGLFEVLVAPGTTQVKLQIEAPEAGPLFPDYTTDELPVGEEQLSVIVPNPPLDIAAYDTTIQVLQPDGLPARGMSLTIQGVLEGGTIRRTTTTDEDGKAHLTVLNGPYECLVVVPNDLPFASWHGFIDLGVQSIAIGGAGTTIQLQERPLFSGRILDAFGAPVTAGTVTLDRDIAKQNGEKLVIAPPDVTLDLDADGGFEALLDPGQWDIIVAPDPETGAPNTHESDVEIGDEGLALDLGLAVPGLLHLTVGGPDGQFLPGVTVELWQPGAEAEKPRLLARGTTSAQGFVDLLVPHAAVDAALTADESL